MIKKEAEQIMKLLIASFPNQQISEETIKIWRGVLNPLQFRSMRSTIQAYILKPNSKFFPAIGELLELYDSIEIKERERRRQQEREDDIIAYRKLFHEPIDDFAEDYQKKSVQLIRDVCNGEIKFESPEWNKRLKGIYG